MFYIIEIFLLKPLFDFHLIIVLDLINNKNWGLVDATLDEIHQV